MSAGLRLVRTERNLVAIHCFVEEHASGLST